MIKDGLAKGTKTFVTVPYHLCWWVWVHFSKTWVDDCYDLSSSIRCWRTNELLTGMGYLYNNTKTLLVNLQFLILTVKLLSYNVVPFCKLWCATCGLINSLHWLESGQSKEEWKGQVETNKVTLKSFLLMVTVFVSVQPLSSINDQTEKRCSAWWDMIRNSNQWAKVVPNTREGPILHL